MLKLDLTDAPFGFDSPFFFNLDTTTGSQVWRSKTKS